jgi:microcystin degradation protein MlrC
MRIGIAGITYEGLPFSPLRTTMKDLHVLRGQEILGFDGLGEMAQSLGIEPVPILFAGSLAPSGMFEEQTYLQLREEMLDGFRRAGKLDGICLLFHGALVVENIWSGETDIVRTVRAVVGRDVLISGRMDIHGNITEEFANKTDIWNAKRTAPHRDARETTQAAFSLLARCINKGIRPRPVFIHLPLLLQGERATTGVEPMKTMIAMVKEIEKKPGILTAQVFIGFGWADAPHAGSSVAVFAEDDAHLPAARAYAKSLAQAMWDRRGDFTFDQEVAPTADEAIDRALQAKEPTVFLTDSGDNVTAGTPGDSPHFLSRLLAKNVPDAVFASIPDEEVAALCFSKGVGATVSVRLGAKIDKEHGDPIQVTGVVEHLYRPAPGAVDAMMATLRVDGIHIIVAARRKAFTRLEDFRHAGVEPLQHKIVVDKLGYLMPELRDAAPREILSLTPGFADMDLTRLPYRYVNRPCYPLDKDMKWRPLITNVAGYED